ncbi:MAG: ribosome silencing factor [Flavobacteriales bacterium]
MTQSISLLDLVIKGIQDVKGENISILDLRETDNSVSDYFVICTGRSSTNAKSIADSVSKETELGLDDRPWHVEGKNNAEWILMDYSELVVHIFTEESRDFYALEDLWADAKIERIKELV